MADWPILADKFKQTGPWIKLLMFMTPNKDNMKIYLMTNLMILI
jgi:hypothetical protein